MTWVLLAYRELEKSSRESYADILRGSSHVPAPQTGAKNA